MPGKNPPKVKAETAKNVKSRIPTAATKRALEELHGGKLNSYTDADDLFAKNGIKIGNKTR